MWKEKQVSEQLACTPLSETSCSQWATPSLVHSAHTRLNGAAKEPAPLSLSARETCCLEQVAYLPYFSLLWRQDTQKSCFRHPGAHWICFLPPAQHNQYQQSVMHLPVLAEVQANGNCILVRSITWAPCLAVTGFIVSTSRRLVLYHLQPAFHLFLFSSRITCLSNWVHDLSNCDYRKLM